MSSPKCITVLDTSVGSTNLGDQIIMEAVRKHLAPLLDNYFPFTVATHEWLGAKSRGLIHRSSFAVAGGTNLLSSRMWFRPLWKLSPWDASLGRKITLMGAGWYQHQHRPDPYTRRLLRCVLRADGIHSVRDSYTEQMLRSIGVSNVLNTGCPTLWDFTSAQCEALPTAQASQVVTTLNSYMKAPERDRKLLETLERSYDTVYLWPQSVGDAAYVNELATSKLTLLKPTVEAYDHLLTTHADLDYVGLRLHGGIRALQHGRRSIIIEIDNRAAVMGADRALPTVAQGDWDRLNHLISGSFETRVNVPTAAIEEWKQQFGAALPG